MGDGFQLCLFDIECIYIYDLYLITTELCRKICKNNLKYNFKYKVKYNVHNMLIKLNDVNVYTSILTELNLNLTSNIDDNIL